MTSLVPKATKGLKKYIFLDSRRKLLMVPTNHKEVNAEKLWPLLSPSFLEPDYNFSPLFIAWASCALLDFKAFHQRRSANVYHEKPSHWNYFRFLRSAFLPLISRPLSFPSISTGYSDWSSQYRYPFLVFPPARCSSR